MDRDGLSAAIVSVTFMEASDPQATEVSGTGVIWVTEDMTVARNLKDQLIGLLGSPAAEQLLPSIAFEAIGKLPNSWPGSVTMKTEDQE